MEVNSRIARIMQSPVAPSRIQSCSGTKFGQAVLSVFEDFPMHIMWFVLAIDCNVKYHIKFPYTVLPATFWHFDIH